MIIWGSHWLWHLNWQLEWLLLAHVCTAESKTPHEQASYTEKKLGWRLHGPSLSPLCNITGCLCMEKKLTKGTGRNDLICTQFGIGPPRHIPVTVHFFKVLTLDIWRLENKTFIVGKWSSPSLIPKNQNPRVGCFLKGASLVSAACNIQKHPWIPGAPLSRWSQVQNGEYRATSQTSGGHVFGRGQVL